MGKQIAAIAVLLVVVASTSAGSLEWLDKWKVGDKGTCAYTPYVFQVIRAKNQLLLGSKSDGPLVLMTLDKSLTTKGVQPRRQFSFGKHVIHVTGTVTYETLDGREVTVLAATLSPK